MKLTKARLRQVIKEVSQRLLEHSDAPSNDRSSWADLADQVDGVSKMIGTISDKYITRAWLWRTDSGKNIATSVAEKLKQLHGDAEALSELIRKNAVYTDYIAWADSKGHITPTASSVMATYFDEVSLSADQKALLADQAGLELRDVEYYQSS